MASSTRVLPVMDMSIISAFRTQLMMTIASGQESLPLLPEKSVPGSFNSLLGFNFVAYLGR